MLAEEVSRRIEGERVQSRIELAARRFVGEHDFAAFCRSAPDRSSLLTKMMRATSESLA